MYASHSKLECAEGCPRRYKRRYLDKVEEPPAAPFIIGRAAHRLFARYGGRCFAQGVATDVTAIADLARAVCFDEQDPEAPGAAYYSEIVELGQKFAQAVQFPKGATWLELRLPPSWDPDQGKWPAVSNLGVHKFVGIIDRLDLEPGGLAVITDWKTDHQADSQAEVERNPQLRRYVWLASGSCQGAIRYKVRLHFVRHAIIREVEYDAGMVPELERELLAAVNSLAARTEFPATPGESCGICGYVGECPALRDAGEIPKALGSEAEAKAALERLLVHDKLVATLKDRLKVWCATNGPVAVNGMAIGHWKTESKGIVEVEKFFHLLSDTDLDPWKFLTVSADHVEAAQKALGDGFPADLLVDRSYTRFDKRKAPAAPANGNGTGKQEVAAS